MGDFDKIHLYWSACKHCTWPSHNFGDGESCGACFANEKYMINYITRRIKTCIVVLPEDLENLLISFIVNTEKIQEEYYDVADPYGKVYGATLMGIKYQNNHDVGLFKYIDWTEKWDEYIYMNSPRIFDYKTYSLDKETHNGTCLTGGEEYYNLIRREMRIANNLRSGTNIQLDDDGDTVMDYV